MVRRNAENRENWTRSSPQCWAHWSKTQSSLLYFYLSYSLAPNEQIWSLSPRMSFFIVQSQVIQSNTPFEWLVSSILTERIHIHCLWRSSLLGPGMNLKTDKKERKHTRILRTKVKCLGRTNPRFSNQQRKLLWTMELLFVCRWL